MTITAKIKKRAPIFTIALLLILAISISANTRDKILENTANYCEKLKKEIFHFFCLETITETIHKSLEHPEEKRGLKNFLEGIKPERERSQYESVRQLNMMKRKRSYSSRKYERKNIFVNEYQIIKKTNRIQERRNNIKSDILKGDKNTKKPGLQTIIYSYQNAIFPIYLFSKENQDKFHYKILGKEKTLKRNAHIIQVSSKKGNDQGDILATVWIDQEDFSILKLNVLPAAFEGYEYLTSNLDEKSDVTVTDVHYFGQMKKGIRFPTRTEITLSYKEKPDKIVESTRRERIYGARILTKISTVYNYKKYTFFRVAVSEPIFKTVKYK
ncbi:MAG: hypothetical protein GY950_14920 [bacterium]|nr:hypothetical protein [bacterium]